MRLRVACALAGLSLLLAACAGQRPRTDTASPAARAPSAARGSRLPPDTARSQSERYRQADDNGPAAPPIDVSTIAEPVPKIEPRSHYGNKQIYSVLGQTYNLLPTAHGYVERGLASWYGNKFHGYMTSSFEPYDMYAFSAAHKTLPLPSYARVTNLANGKSVIVRINDRGPFHENRLIDLSYAAAVRIGIWPKGTGMVEVRAIDAGQPEPLVAPTQLAARSAQGDRTAQEPARPQRPLQRAGPFSPLRSASAETRREDARDPSARAPALVARADSRAALPGSASAPHIYLQLGAFGDRANAERACANATRAGLDHVGIESVAVAGHTVHRVRVGPLADADAVDALSTRIEKLGLGAPRVAIER